MSVYMTAARSAPAPRAGEEIIFAPESPRTDGAFGGVVGHFEPAVVDEAS